MKVHISEWSWIAAGVLALCSCASDDANEPEASEEPSGSGTPGEPEEPEAPEEPMDTIDTIDVDPGAIVITELMPNVSALSPDWVELYNSTDSAIELEGCVLTDDRDDRFVIDAPLTVEPGQYAVLASAPDTGPSPPAALVEPAYVFSDAQFRLDAPGPDQVILTCGDRVIDRVAYSEYDPGPATGTRGWQLDPAAIDASANDDGANWCYTPLPVITEDYLYNDDSVASAGVDNPPCSVFPYAYYDQEDVILEGIDLDATLEIAELELAQGGGPSVLVIWAIRDQIVTPVEAAAIADLYALYIEDLYGSDPVGIYDWNFGVWHFAWAISNLYRNGSDEVRAALQAAYDDALDRPETVERFRLIAIDHVRGNHVLMGDIHETGRMFAQTHIVVPGNPDYLQSLDEYLEMNP